MKASLAQLIVLSFVGAGCVSVPSRWAAGPTDVATVCTELAKLPQLESMESRRVVMDTFGFETTNYSDGSSQVAVLTRPDLVIVIPREMSKSRNSVLSNFAAAKMWKSIGTHIEALRLTADQSRRKLDTVFLGDPTRWSAEKTALQQNAFHGNFVTITFDRNMIAVQDQEVPQGRTLTASEPKDIL